MTKYFEVKYNQARKYYYEGYNVAILPSKMRVDNGWMPPYEFNLLDTLTFEGECNAYKYYNCSSECGNALKYYIREDLKGVEDNV